MNEEERKLKKIIDEQKSQLKSLSASHSTLEGRITELEIDQDKLNGTLTDKNEQINDLNNQLKELKTKLTEAKGKLKGQKGQESEFEEKLKELGNLNIACFAYNLKIEFKNKQLESKLAEAEDTKKILKKKFKKKDKEVENLKLEVTINC